MAMPLVKTLRHKCSHSDIYFDLTLKQTFILYNYVLSCLEKVYIPYLTKMKDIFYNIATEKSTLMIKYRPHSDDRFFVEKLFLKKDFNII